MIKILQLLLIAALSLTNCVAQKAAQSGYEKIVKIAPADSLLPIPAAVKKQLKDYTNHRSKSYETRQLLLTGSDRKLVDITSRWLAAKTGKSIYRISLSALISKYIGETEKNLDRVFSRAENDDLILFFDEADALFGKRTEVKDAHDKYANQEVAYLLQRIERFNGIVFIPCNSADCIRDFEKLKIIKIAD
jgi:SpoVK/Ycf46/Vps4 family AAA+-type ATPase